MLNRVILIGRLANDPELKYTPSGIAVAQFRIAVDRPISAEARSQGQEKQADFIDIVSWRQNAEFAANYLGKGRLVAVEGKLQIREYVTADGQRRRTAEVVTDNLKSLDRPKDQGEGGGGGGGYDNGAQQQQGGDEEQQPQRPAAPPQRTAAPAAARTGGGQGGFGGGAPQRTGGAPAGGGNRNAPNSTNGGGDPFDDGFEDISDPFAE